MFHNCIFSVFFFLYIYVMYNLKITIKVVIGGKYINLNKIPKI